MKRQRLLTVFGVLSLLACCILPGKALAATYGNYTYTVSNGQATITDCNTSISGKITIPSTLGGYPVTGIDDDAFYNCGNMTSVVIPNSVTFIGDCAFEDCVNLTSVTIPSSVTRIDDEAFAYCEKLVSVALPSSINRINEGVFRNCSSLQSVTIPSSITYIDKAAFVNCGSLTSISIPSSVTYIGDSAFSSSGLTSVFLPNGGITSINQSVFAYCSNLRSVSIPNSVTYIGMDAFFGCSSLTSVTLPNRLGGIGESAFYNCSNLQSINIPNGVTSIGNNAFQFCRSLKTLTIPTGINRIGENTFYGCEKLTDITIPDGVTDIGKYAFYDCGSLNTVRIPKSVTTIGIYAFSNIGDSLKVTYCGTQTQWNAISFGYGNNSLINAVRQYHNNSIVTTAPTCTTDGYTTKTCKICNEITVTDTIPAKGHSGENWDLIKENTCTQSGLRTRNCEVCGELETQELPAAHSFSSYVVTLPPTCLDAGSQTCTCTVCGYVETQVIAPLRGAGETLIDPTLYPYPESSHNYASNTNETKTFTYPGAETLTIMFSASSQTESDCDKVYILDANGTQLAVYTGSLSGKTLTITGDTFMVKLTSDGSVEKWGYSFSSIVANKGITHTWSNWTETTPPTCTEQGVETRICSYCELQEARTGSNPTGHSGDLWFEIIPATCTAAGMKARICSVCNETETADVAALGHSYSAAVTAPTCTEKGYTTSTCSVCGDTKVTDYVEATGHSFGQWVQTKAPACTEEGEEERACACGTTETQSIPALGHSYESVVTAPTCTEKGYTTNTCSVCSDVSISDYVDAKGHSWSAWIQTVAPTCTKEGSRMHFCNCGTRETEAVEKLPHSYTAGVCSVCGQKNISLAITTVSLRPGSAGIYFGGSFEVDSSLNVNRQGIVVSLVNQAPVADGSDESCLWSQGSTSVLVTNILNAEKDDVDNALNSTMPIYARAYVELADGTIVYSDVVGVNLLEIVQAIDAKWESLAAAQKGSICDMYTTFKRIMDMWFIPNLKNLPEV